MHTSFHRFAVPMRRAILLMVAIPLLYGCAMPSSRQSLATLDLEFALSPEYSSRLATLGGSALKSAAKNLAPSDPWVPVRYEVSGSGPEGATLTLQTAVGSANARLVPGAWTFLVTGFSSAGKPVVRATGEALMEAGRESQVSLTLAPLQGSGTLSLAFSYTYPVAETGRVTGSVRYEGLPGSAVPAGSTRSIDIPVSQSILEMNDLAAGFYRLSLSVQDGGGTVGGMSEMVLILEGHRTEGSCVFQLGQPSLSLSVSSIPVSLDTSIIPQVPMTVSRAHRFSLAAFDGGESSPGIWSVNGADAGMANPASRDGQPTGMLLSTAQDASGWPIHSRADILVGPGTTGAYGSAYSLVRAGEGPADTRWSWRATLGADAGLVGSRFNLADPDNAGTGTPARVDAIAATANGLVAVAGLDHDHALHLFSSSAGSAYTTDSGTSIAKSGSGLVRLWRDKLVVNSSARGADRLAFSKDGRRLAISSSSGTWLRVIHLGTTGEIVKTADITYSSAGFAEFDSVKALEFSPDGSKLYALVNSPEAVYVLGTGTASTSLPLLDRMALDSLSENPTMSMDDLACAPDGTLVASAARIGKAYVLKTIDGLLNYAGVLNPPASSPWTAPGALEFSADGLDLYLLGNDRMLYRYHRDAFASGFTYKDQLALPASVHGVDRMAYGTVDSATGSQPCLGLSGGPGLALVGLPVPSLASATVDTLLPGLADATGTGTIVDGAFTGRTFAAAGDGACVISLFGSD